MIDGVGEYRWPDGKVYIGEWSNNRIHGKGEFTWIDGRKYIGEYNYDRK